MKYVDISWIKIKGRIKIDKGDLLLALYYAKEEGVSIDELIENINETGMIKKEIIKVL